MPVDTDMSALGASLPSLVGHAIRGPAMLTRTGSDLLVFLDAYGRLRPGAPRPPAIDARSHPDS